MSKRIELQRHPFARETTIRKLEESSEGCTWCGKHRPGDKLFRYGVETDNYKKVWDTKLFCSIGCRNLYVGQ